MFDLGEELELGGLERENLYRTFDVGPKTQGVEKGLEKKDLP